MSEDSWCASHRQRLLDTNDARVMAETLIVKLVLETGRVSQSNGCWACCLTENEFLSSLREGITVTAAAETYGGTYTTDKIMLSLGTKKSDLP